MKVIRSYALHLDKLRKYLDLTQEEFCHGIVNTRTYRKYLKGEVAISHDVLIQFCEKIGMGIAEFYYSEASQDRYELYKIKRLYYIVDDYKFLEDDTFDEVNKEIDITKLSHHDLVFYEFCVLKYQYVTNSLSYQEVLERAKELINYPDCSSKDWFDFIDLAVLQLISEIELKENKFTAIDLLTYMLSNFEKLYFASDSRDILFTIYGNTVVTLLESKDYKTCNKISDIGIKYSDEYHNMAGIKKLFSSAAISKLRLGEKERARILATRCVATTFITGNRKEMKYYEELLYKELGLSAIQLINTSIKETVS